MNQKRKFSPFKPKKQWQRDDSEAEESFDEQEEFELSDLEDLLRRLLEECAKLNMLLSHKMPSELSMLKPEL